MRFRVGGRQVELEMEPIVLASVSLGWSLYYYFSTVNKPRGGAESVLFIGPLTIALAICFVFLVLRSVKVSHEKGPVEGSRQEGVAGDRGFLDHRRLFFAASLVAYAAGLTFFGYLIPSIVFVCSVFYYLGVRSLWVLTVLPVVLCGFLSIAFKMLKVPVPIWPSW